MSKGLGWGRKVKIPMVLSDFCLAVPRRVDFWTTNSSSSVKGFSGGFRLTVLVQGACRTVYFNSLQAELQTTMETSLRFPWGLISRIGLFFAGDCQENIASKPISGSTPSILLLRVLLLPSVCCLKYVKIILNLCSNTFLILILLCENHLKSS